MSADWDSGPREHTAHGFLPSARDTFVHLADLARSEQRRQVLEAEVIELRDRLSKTEAERALLEQERDMALYRLDELGETS